MSERYPANRNHCASIMVWLTERNQQYMRAEKALMHKSIVIVGGCGHVGLPLGLVFAGQGCDVTLLDIDTQKIDRINSGQMPFRENGADKLLRQVVGTK